MYDKVTFHVKGIVPTIMHNGSLSNPINPIVKEIKKISSKRKKTDEDFQLLRELEWIGGIYTEFPKEFTIGENRKNRIVKLSCKGFPGWPGENIESALFEAGKINRFGKLFKSSIICDGFFPLEIPGNKTIEEYFLDDTYFDCRSVVIQKNRIMRTRPIFRNWELLFTLNYLPNIVEKDSIIEAIEKLGEIIGISDNRPKFGRFEIVEIS